jgi:hypothetical protein
VEQLRKGLRKNDPFVSLLRQHSTEHLRGSVKGIQQEHARQFDAAFPPIAWERGPLAICAVPDAGLGLTP